MAEGEGQYAFEIPEFNGRRMSRRYPFIASAAVVDLNSNSRLGTRTADIGLGGCYINTSNPFQLGTSLILRLNNENQSFQTNAKVVSVQSGTGMGLAFTTLAKEQLRTLEGWICRFDSAAEKIRAKRELVHSSEPAKTAGGPTPLTYLVLILVRKNILTEMEAKVLLDRIWQ